MDGLFTEQQLQSTTQQSGNAIIGLQNQNNQLQHQAQNLASQSQLKAAKIQALEAEAEHRSVTNEQGGERNVQ